MGRYIKKTGQTTPVNAVVENTWSGSTVNAPSVAMVQDALVGENMLINSDFRSGIINQKGQTQYVHSSGARTYGIDCWYVNGENSSMAINDKFLSVNLHNNGDFGCVLNIDKDYEKYFTFTIQRNLAEAQSVTFDVSTMNENQDYFFDIDDNTKIGIYFWRSSNVYKSWFYLKRDGITNIDFMKLERGKYFTGMPVWNYPTEFLKCAHKYINFYGQAIKRTAYIGNAKAYITYELPTIMNENITCIIREDTNMLWQNDDTQSPVSTPITSATVIAKQGNAVTVQFNGSFGNENWRVAFCSGVGIELDTYDY